MIKFIDKETLLYFHSDQIRKYGGSEGIRDIPLLESALAQPQATFRGKYLHKDIFEMAAAYGYHLCKNHPFIDGNKRISLISMYTFLFMNGFELRMLEKEIYLLIMGIADSSISKQELAEYLKKYSIKLSKT